MYLTAKEVKLVLIIEHSIPNLFSHLRICSNRILYICLHAYVFFRISQPLIQYVKMVVIPRILLSALNLYHPQVLLIQLPN